jgi:hypothetical protein
MCFRHSCAELPTSGEAEEERYFQACAAVNIAPYGGIKMRGDDYSRLAGVDALYVVGRHRNDARNDAYMDEIHGHLLFGRTFYEFTVCTDDCAPGVFDRVKRDFWPSMKERGYVLHSAWLELGAEYDRTLEATLSTSDGSFRVDLNASKQLLGRIDERLVSWYAGLEQFQQP